MPERTAKASRRTHGGQGQLRAGQIQGATAPQLASERHRPTAQPSDATKPAARPRNGTASPPLRTPQPLCQPSKRRRPAASPRNAAAPPPGLRTPPPPPPSPRTPPSPPPVLPNSNAPAPVPHRKTNPPAPSAPPSPDSPTHPHKLIFGPTHRSLRPEIARRCFTSYPRGICPYWWGVMEVAFGEIGRAWRGEIGGGLSGANHANRPMIRAGGMPCSAQSRAARRDNQPLRGYTGISAVAPDRYGWARSSPGSAGRLALMDQRLAPPEPRSRPSRNWSGRL
jgi:hypothetical protein